LANQTLANPVLENALQFEVLAKSVSILDNEIYSFKKP